MLRPIVTALVATAFLSACSAISALNSAATPTQSYDLQAPVDVQVARSSLARQLVVEVPTAPGGLMTDRIMIRPRPLQAQYLTDGQWASEAPLMMQTLIVRTLEDSNGFRYVGRRPLGSFGDYVLISEMTDLQAEAAPDGKSATIRVRLTARLVRESDASVMATRTFNASVPVATTETIALVEGFNSATQSVLKDLSAWVLSSLGVRTG
ncbi:MAG: ABC-type transport auxiliary lipoprotein family protein [Pseudotabrizicola sp.]|uniref:ABC-type transport auxiliary lipoprotein family protein n=1 Tax=Pseudotabrizicola sp. TaxID=2939647 RepID=UPI002716B852|nr:ABC-type transport auxiliary lipoprotein family protein [Pseudotabrizicola sp.]MDO8882082.1 ABC-type transport auxiliary lipoprotein family protein [Pseudotabrizicola sp.]MDP2081388.1 ABC-type transport auxiliary lipoprotein family protein [Pseudotabrizicola sp.]MDZ7572901.1 ABC-type transport auxiliary lipoprotein family protein [Pseudotabrizicola sp.]